MIINKHLQWNLWGAYQRLCIHVWHCYCMWTLQTFSQQHASSHVGWNDLGQTVLADGAKWPVAVSDCQSWIGQAEQQPYIISTHVWCAHLFWRLFPEKKCFNVILHCKQFSVKIQLSSHLKSSSTSIKFNYKIWCKLFNVMYAQWYISFMMFSSFSSAVLQLHDPMWSSCTMPAVTFYE